MDSEISLGVAKTHDLDHAAAPRLWVGASWGAKEMRFQVKELPGGEGE